MILFIFFHNIIFFNAIQGCVKNAFPNNQTTLFEAQTTLQGLTSDPPKAQAPSQNFLSDKRSNESVDSSRETKKKEKMEDFSRKKFSIFLEIITIK